MVDTEPLPCVRCGAPTAQIALLQGGSLTMFSCSRCDHRSWYRDGAPAPLREVLASVEATAGKGRSAEL
jgi:hypothetical protein